MKRGHVIEIKEGLFGIQAPNNLAIFLDRITRKKEVFFSVYTIKGKKEIRRNQVAKKSFPDAKIDIPKGLPDKKLDSILKPRLQDFINNLGKKTGKTVYQRKKDTKSSETVLPPTDEHQLWRFVLKEFSDSFETGLSVNEIAEKWFRESPSAKQVQAIDEVLHESKSQGYGYFRYTDQKKFIPLSTSEYDSIKNNIKDIEKIRNRLVEKEEFEDDEGYIQVRYIPVGLEYATFSESDMEIVKQIQNWMAELIQTKTIKVGLGGTFIHTIDKFSLPQFLRFLAEDWTETRDLFQPDSAMVEFLLRTDYLEEDQALEILAKRAVRDYPNFSWDVDEEMQSIALGLPDPEDEPDSYKKRKDLRNLETYSVDPATARDFDQALSYTKKEDGSYILWVHIADVSHYVTPGSNLDEYAKQRATSVYLPSRGLPMHPPALSTGLCALQQDVDRFSLTCELHYDPEGNRTKVDIYESVVHVDGNLSYEFVDEKLEQNDPYWTGMLELGDLLRSKFIGLHIETKEARLSSTGVGQLGFKVEEATPSTSMNEIFMIRANEAIAEFIRDSGQPGLYRSHPIPDKPDVEKFNDQMAALGIDYEVEIPERPQSFLNLNEESSEAEVLEDNTSILDMLKSGGKMTLMAGGITTKKKKSDKKSTSKKNVEEDKETEKERKKPLMFGLAHLSDEELDKWMQPFREVLEEVRNVEEESDRMVMMLTILGMFGRAYYTQDNVGHFGLGSKCYTHFTAPIRRYSDIIVHRILKGLIRGISSIENPVYSEEDLDQLSDYITDQSYDAETLERRVVGAGLAMMTRRPEWSKDLIGVVTRVSPRYISVIIKEVLDGRIRTRDLSKQEIIVDPSESIAFIKRDEQRTIQKILSSSDWQELLDDDNEPIEVLIRLGDKKSVKIIGRDYIEGKVSVVLS